VLAAPLAEAQGRKARLSQDLAEHLNAKRESPARVIVNGSPEQIEALAARHGAVVRKQLRMARCST
jgi:hypothetical protein